MNKRIARCLLQQAGRAIQALLCANLLQYCQCQSLTLTGSYICDATKTNQEAQLSIVKTRCSLSYTVLVAVLTLKIIQGR